MKVSIKRGLNILTGDTKKEQNARNNYLLGRQTYGTLTKTFKSYWDTKHFNLDSQMTLKSNPCTVYKWCAQARLLRKVSKRSLSKIVNRGGQRKKYTIHP